MTHPATLRQAEEPGRATHPGLYHGGLVAPDQLPQPPAGQWIPQAAHGAVFAGHVGRQFPVDPAVGGYDRDGAMSPAVQGRDQAHEEALGAPALAAADDLQAVGHVSTSSSASGSTRSTSSRARSRCG